MTGLAQIATTPTRPAARSRLMLTGELSAAVAIVPVPGAVAQAMLPAGLRLAPQHLMSGDRHPLILILGRQANVGARYLPLRAGYLECIAVVPFVAGGSGGPLCHLPRLFLDRRLPTLAGRWLYGYDKRRADITMTDERYQIVALDGGEPLLEARYRTTGAALDPTELGAARTLFELPVITRKSGAWSYSCAAFDLDQAQLEPLALELTIASGAIPGLPATEFVLDGLRNGPGGAFRLRTGWTLAGPWRSPPGA